MSVRSGDGELSTRGPSTWLETEVVRGARNKPGSWIELSDDLRAEGIFLYNSWGEAWRPRLERPGPKPLVIPDPVRENEAGMDVGAADVVHTNEDDNDDDDDDSDDEGDASGESDVD